MADVVGSVEEFEKVIRENDLVLVEVCKSDSKWVRYTALLTENLENMFRKVKIIRVDLNRTPDLAARLPPAPSYVLFICGEAMWEQRGVFGNIDTDSYVIYDSVREAIRKFYRR